MTEVFILVEGQTEETFVKRVLAPHFSVFPIWITPIIVTTNGADKGGLGKYASVRKQLTILRRRPNIWLTTMFDFYALPRDFPGYKDLNYARLASGLDKVLHLETALQADLAFQNFIPNIVLHEFEAILFSDPQKFDIVQSRPALLKQMEAIRASVTSPEDINEFPNSAPSKRILQIYPNYQKPLHGAEISMKIGLDKIRQQCPHFASWLARLEALPRIF
jgi:hypothetical protein